ncbi:hypothetical protein [Aureispira anguillae]|uniref:Uncharacterized protein n=1 Tax=Aureispira anguillae TaxID=2864201 RepID=A0A915YC29_9BACT|nr:hypothetical protein [Aureispira anguillae]BDS10334.1 hypothetical protein AsAng_0010420 [Aureispira anguillae]
MSVYFSPFKLFNLPLDANSEVLQANRERISEQIKHYKETELVYIGNNKLIKQDVLKLLRELDNFYTRQYHISIYEHKKLLNFLEYGHLNYFRNKVNLASVQDADFFKFIAPYFGFQYGETLLQAIKTQDKETLALLSAASLPMVGDFEEQCYRHANLYVETTIKELKKLQAKQELHHMSERELLSYLPNRTIELYNMLPDYFYAARNLIGNEIYQLSVVLTQNFGRSDGASAMLKQGLKLKLDETVRKNLEAMLGKFSFKYKVPTFIWVAFLAVAILFMMKYIETNFLGG